MWNECVKVKIAGIVFSTFSSCCIVYLPEWSNVCAPVRSPDWFIFITCHFDIRCLCSAPKPLKLIPPPLTHPWCALLSPPGWAAGGHEYPTFTKHELLSWCRTKLLSHKSIFAFANTGNKLLIHHRLTRPTQRWLNWILIVGNPYLLAQHTHCTVWFLFSDFWLFLSWQDQIWLVSRAALLPGETIIISLMTGNLRRELPSLLPRQ